MDEKKILTELAPYVGWRINVEDGPPKLEKGPRTDTPTTPHPSLAPRMRERFRDFMLFEQAIIVNLPEERAQEVFYKLNPKNIETEPGAHGYGGPFFYLDRVEFGTDRYDVKMSPLLEKALYEEKDPKVPYNYFLQEVGSWAVEEAKRALAAAREAGNRAAIEEAEAKLKQEQDEANAAKEAAPAKAAEAAEKALEEWEKFEKSAEERVDQWRIRRAADAAAPAAAAAAPAAAAAKKRWKTPGAVAAAAAPAPPAEEEGAWEKERIELLEKIKRLEEELNQVKSVIPIVIAHIKKDECSAVKAGSEFLDAVGSAFEGEPKPPVPTAEAAPTQAPTPAASTTPTPAAITTPTPTAAPAAAAVTTPTPAAEPVASGGGGKTSKRKRSTLGKKKKKTKQKGVRMKKKTKKSKRKKGVKKRRSYRK